MKWTKFFIPTSKEIPADAVVPSHQLMLRAGMIRQLAAGSYTYLPLGFRVLQKVESIIREEMNRAGAIELHMPAMQPLELWQETSRDEAMGATLVRLTDKNFRRNTVLGPTHEEAITDIVRAYVNSYKQLPVTLYQIQTKFRDEERPKSGVLRTREFLMKDAYSFNPDKASLDESYERMYAAYCRIYERCGLPYVAVEADSGAIGGDASHEFMVTTNAGEDYLVRAQDGSYAANVERAEILPLPDEGCAGQDELKEVHTPGMSTIEDVSAFLKCRPQDMIKTLIYTVRIRPAGSKSEDKIRTKAVVALVRGNHEANDAKLSKAVKAIVEASGFEVATLDMAEPEFIQNLTQAQVGFAGPVGLDKRDDVILIADRDVTTVHNGVTGANKTDYHVAGLNIGRDYEVANVADIRFAVEGDKAPNGSPLTFEKCIEVGHVFKLGTKYSDAMKATYLDQNGKSKSIIMGCYGIGVNRIVAAAIEACHDDAGICWPVNIAPFAVEIVALDVRDQKVQDTANRLHDQLQAEGIDVLLDDRDARPGFKFKDADLIGIPIRVTVGKRGLDENIVEFKLRTSSDMERIAPDAVIAKVKEQLVHACR